MSAPERRPFIGGFAGAGAAEAAGFQDMPVRDPESEAWFEAMLGEFGPIYREHKAFVNRQRRPGVRASQRAQRLSPLDVGKVRQALRDAFPPVTGTQASTAGEALRNAFKDQRR